MASTPSTQTTINKTELPQWVQDAAQKNLGIADQIAAKPYQAYTGDLTAGPSALQTQAFNSAGQTAGQWNPAMAAAANTATAGTNFSYKPTSFLNANVKDYMNPYVDAVKTGAINNANIALKQNLNAIGDSAVGAGAFGGSRHGVAEGVASAEGARQIGDLSAQLDNEAFNNAQAAWNTDVNRDMTNAYQQQAVRSQSADQLSNIAQAGSQMNNQTNTLLAMLGGQQQQLSQQDLSAQYAQWKEQQDYPTQQLNLRLAALGATPYGGTQSQTSTAAGGGNQAMSMFGGLLGALPFLAGLSDKNDKTDIEKLGKDPETGLDLYAYRYKGDPKSYPKVVGPMAQDLKKKDPDSVKKVGGHMVVKQLGSLGFGGGLPMKRAA
jgi:hypothetical protein